GQIAYEIDKEVQRIIKEQYERCKDILLEHQSQLLLIAESLLKEETLVAELIRSLFYDGVLPEVDYDAAKVVSDQESEINEGKYSKSYEDGRKEQLEVGKQQEKEDQQEEKDIDKSRRDSEHDNDDSEETGHEQAPNIDKPSN